MKLSISVLSFLSLLSVSQLQMMTQADSQSSKPFLKEDQSELLMVFEVTRHGARAGLHKEYFNTQWIPGELTNIGRRQHYLLGAQLADRYQQKYKGFIDSTYNPSQIYVRSTDINRTIESAYSQMLGFYQLGDATLNLQDNLTSSALPLFTVADSIKSEAAKMKESIPYNQRFVPIHVQNISWDSFQPIDAMCPCIKQERLKREKDMTIIEQIQAKYGDLLTQVATKLNFTDPEKADPHVVIDSIDNIWARTFDQQPTPGFENAALRKNMMDMYFMYYEYILAGNDTTRALFATGVLSEIKKQFDKTIQMDKKSSNGLGNDRLKLFVYSDHDDSVTVLDKAFEFVLGEYPPYATQILFELTKLNGQYFVSLTVNDKQVPLQRSCQGKTVCEFSNFIALLEQISYISRMDEYNQLCGLATNDATPSQQVLYSEARSLKLREKGQLKLLIEKGASQSSFIGYASSNFAEFSKTTYGRIIIVYGIMLVLLFSLIRIAQLVSKKKVQMVSLVDSKDSNQSRSHYMGADQRSQQNQIEEDGSDLRPYK